MPAQAAVGGLSKFGALKAILGKTPMLFAFVFVLFMLVSTLSQTVNTFQETHNFMDLGIGIGKSIIKPIVASDNIILKTVAEFGAGNMVWYQQILSWMQIMGAISTMYFVFKWIILKIVKTLFPDGMNSDFAIYTMSFYILFSLTTIYNTASSGHLMVGGAGLWSLFTHFTIIFQPVIAIGEPILKAFNLLPDANVPIFGT